MRKCLLQLLIPVFCLLLFSACSGDPAATDKSSKAPAGGTASQESNSSTSLVGGMWTDRDTGISMEFKADGTLHYIQAGNIMSELWLGYKIKDDKIIITYEPGKTETLPFSLQGDVLTVKWETGNSSTLRRASGN
ncbi:MAG: hypothetical protein HPY50_19965 [Firmicutes bacterium]|nr:hypothetical protein [Bacillota bacterium]